MTQSAFDSARTLSVSAQAPVQPQEPILFRDGKITDPDAREAAQALFECFTTPGAKAAVETWLQWALQVGPRKRYQVFMAVWRYYLSVAKIANL